MVKVGLLQPVTGPLQYYGQQSLWGFVSGLAYRGDAAPPETVPVGETTMDVGGASYELLVRDTEFSADRAREAALELVEKRDVDVLVGCSSSQAARAVADDVVAATGVPYLAGPAAAADVIGGDGDRADRVFRASETTAMDARSGGAYVAEETDVDRVFLFGADYSFGRAVVDNYRTVLGAAGVEIVGERLVPPGHEDWERLLDRAAGAGAEGVVGGFTVRTLPALFRTFLAGDYDFRVFGGFATRITNAVVGRTLQEVLGEPLTREAVRATKLGPFTTRYHWNQYDNEINDAFVAAYTEAYGVVPDLFTSGLFTAASAIDQAVAATGSTAADDLAAALRGMTVEDTPKGEDAYTFQAYNNQARSTMTVADLVPTTDRWADAWDAAVMPGEPRARIDGDRVTVPPEEPDPSA